MTTEAEKTLKLLDHLVHHNQHHAEEIEGLVKKAEELGNNEAATLIKEGVVLLQNSNEKLSNALKVLGE